MIEAEDTSLLKTVSPEAIFNLPLYEHYLVIDTRPKQDYEAGHIATAVSYPYPNGLITEEERDATLFHFARDYAKEFYRPENPNPLVLYGAGERDSMSLAHARWLADKLFRLKQQRRTVVPFSSQEAEERQQQALLDEDNFDPFEGFCQTVIDKVQEIWLLQGGYQEFLSEYPFLCGHVLFEEMFPTPHQIVRQVFMGSRVVPLSHDCLMKMGVTHMIISEFQELDLRELDGVMVLRCAIRDRNNENMISCWETSCQFIDQAVLSGGRVLIILHGRSRSASVALAYLIRKMGVGFELAWQHLRSKCWHLIDRSLVYESQLHEWAVLQTHAIPDR